MLELKNIHKDYPAGDGTVHALRGVSITLRRNEFVSILGPSGCGKTTLLNLIGGLDHYTSGDLVINGVSTRDYRDRDWDTYRNHTIGFVFQSYNLIPHQSVLRNVELALTLSGVSKGERRKRAVAALESVGLGDQLRKRPSQLSGGQMQRVAIARALVNDPDIILADEPTGALDTETSVQVMDILQEVAKDRLVIMVTHNPDLAEKYSTRIINMLDGEITADSNPISESEAEEMQALTQEARKAGKRERKPSMRFTTAFGLSLNNLISKRGRTILTSFAGSIGIIGIALIFAVSNGLNTYINVMQEDTLSSYPLTLQAQHLDTSTFLMTFIGNALAGEPHENDAVYQQPIVYDMVNALGAIEQTENDLKAFKAYLETERAVPESELAEAINGIAYTYDVPLLVYTKSVDGAIIQSDAQTLMQELILEYFGTDMSTMMSMGETMGMGSSAMTSMSPMAGGINIWQEMLTGDNGALINPLLEKQYDLIYGSWPNSYNEVVLIVDKNNEIDDMTLYALGLKSKADIDALAKAAFTQTPVEKQTAHWSYEEICNMRFRVILPASCYALDETTSTWHDLRDTEAGMRYLYDNGIDLQVTGILKPNEEAVAGMLTGAIGYTADLTRYIVENAAASPAVQAQEASPETDIFTALPFRSTTGDMTDAEKAAAFREYIGTLSAEKQAGAYIQMMSIPTQAQLDGMMAQALGGMTRTDMENAMLQALSGQMSVRAEDVMAYVSTMTDEELATLFAQMMGEQLKAQYAQQVSAQMAAMPAEQLQMGLQMTLANSPDSQMALWHDELLSFSESTLEENLLTLGVVDLDQPSSINIYASSFENKDVIEAAIASYNATVDDLEQIRYTDYVGLMMSSITSIINAITYVLIAFVAISLVVSSIMIGVITLISVQERTKEIGILRAIGASKRNVSSMFTAETLIIGFTAGAIGVAVTWLLCIPINAIIQHVTGLPGLEAYLPVEVAVLLVLISMVLTLFTGIIPSRSAARKDPVVALRTE